MHLVPAELIRDQLVAVFSAWGMSDDHARTTTEAMVETDLRGVDSHGIAMLMSYDAEFQRGRLNMRPDIRIVRDSESTALIDADASMGHVPSVMAMNLAVDKARATGVGVVSVINSHHFGAAGVYAGIASDRGVLGFVSTSARGILMVPTRSAEAMLGTNPLAFAAPASKNPPFLLDMATTTVAGGKIKVHELKHEPLPPGWVIDSAGESVTDASQAVNNLYTTHDGGITPLGNRAELGSHKGYGLAVMAHVLASTLGGAAFTNVYRETQGPSDPHNLGHFFLAIDPGYFRPFDEFTADMDVLIDTLHSAKPVDPDEPVLVAGDPERQMRAHRVIHGIPIPDELASRIRQVAERAPAPFLLD